jgi:hypothetical protein
MARPIKETPILKGSDARRFLKEQKQDETRKVSDQRRQEIRESYNLLSRAAKF